MNGCTGQGQWDSCLPDVTDVPRISACIREMIVLFKPQGWEIDSADCGHARWISLWLELLIVMSSRTRLDILRLAAELAFV